MNIIVENNITAILINNNNMKQTKGKKGTLNR